MIYYKRQNNLFEVQYYYVWIHVLNNKHLKTPFMLSLCNKITWKIYTLLKYLKSASEHSWLSADDRRSRTKTFFTNVLYPEGQRLNPLWHFNILVKKKTFYATAQEQQILVPVLTSVNCKAQLTKLTIQTEGYLLNKTDQKTKRGNQLTE